MKQSFKIMVLWTVLILLLGFSACGKIKIHMDEASAPPLASEAVQEPSNDSFYNPLSGAAESIDLSAVRPYAVMVNNISVAQPQIGVGKADWIYELEAEGGITRMMALFTHLQDVPSVGSVRSMRPYFLSLAMSYDAVLIHAGGSEDAYSDCDMYQWDHLDGVRDASAFAAVFYRDPSRSSHGVEHSVFLSCDRVSAYTEQVGFRQNHNDGYQNSLVFSDDSASQCTGNGSYLEVKLSESKSTSFHYHPDSGIYTGTQYGTDYIDGTDGQPVQFSNLLVLMTQITDYHDELGHIAVDVVGSGTGYYFTGGKSLPIRWTRDSVNASFCYTVQDGSPLTFAPGKTYCAFVSADPNSISFY